MGKICLVHRNLDVDESGDVGVAVPCVLRGYYISNKNTSMLFVKIYNTAIAALSTDTPVLTLGIPGGGGANLPPTDDGILSFNAGLALRATTATADSDTGAPSDNDVIVNIFYF